MQNLTQKGHKLQNMGKKNAKPSHNSYPFSIRMLSGQNQDTKKRWTGHMQNLIKKGLKLCNMGRGKTVKIARNLQSSHNSYPYSIRIISG